MEKIMNESAVATPETASAPVSAENTAGVANQEAKTETPSTLLAGVQESAETTQTPEETKQTGEAAKTSEVPEKYEFQAPEGMELNTDMLDKFIPVAKELGLSNEKAQKFIDLAVEQQKMIAMQHMNQINEWGNQTKADKEIGGENFDNSIKNALNFLDKYGKNQAGAKDPELYALLNPPSPNNPRGLGLGNHPAIIRLLATAGAAMGEDQTRIVNSGPSVGSLESAAKKMFPEMK
jgi:hypothetical protein